MAADEEDQQQQQQLDAQRRRALKACTRKHRQRLQQLTAQNRELGEWLNRQDDVSAAVSAMESAQVLDQDIRLQGDGGNRAAPSVVLLRADSSARKSSSVKRSSGSSDKKFRDGLATKPRGQRERDPTRVQLGVLVGRVKLDQSDAKHMMHAVVEAKSDGLASHASNARARLHALHSADASVPLDEDDDLSAGEDAVTENEQLPFASGQVMDDGNQSESDHGDEVYAALAQVAAVEIGLQFDKTANTPASDGDFR